jgi:hypothetical protein
LHIHTTFCLSIHPPDRGVVSTFWLLFFIHFFFFSFSHDNNLKCIILVNSESLLGALKLNAAACVFPQSLLCVALPQLLTHTVMGMMSSQGTKVLKRTSAITVLTFVWANA